MNERIFNRILAGRTVTNRTVSNLEPKLFESDTLEFFFSATVFYEVHHQNFKHQQHRSERNP
jgi:hypothetical protein